MFWAIILYIVRSTGQRYLEWDRGCRRGNLISSLGSGCQSSFIILYTVLWIAKMTNTSTSKCVLIHSVLESEWVWNVLPSSLVWLNRKWLAIKGNHGYLKSLNKHEHKWIALGGLYTRSNHHPLPISPTASKVLYLLVFLELWH